jgi:hypothetical protein
MKKESVEFKKEAQFREFFEKNLDKFDVQSIKLSQEVTPDYVCIMKDESVKNVEAELHAEDFLRHDHPLEKVDLIVCAFSSVYKIHGIPVKSLDYNPSEVVVIASAEPERAEEGFWKENRWGWLSIDEKRFPQYLALYVKKPVAAIDRIAKIDQDKTTRNSKDGKYCFVFEWKRKLGYPIRLGKKARIQGRQYVPLSSFMAARTIDDLKEE